MAHSFRGLSLGSPGPFVWAFGEAELHGGEPWGARAAHFMVSGGRGSKACAGGHALTWGPSVLHIPGPPLPPGRHQQCFSFWCSNGLSPSDPRYCSPACLQCRVCSRNLPTAWRCPLPVELKAGTGQPKSVKGCRRLLPGHVCMVVPSGWRPAFSTWAVLIHHP